MVFPAGLHGDIVAHCYEFSGCDVEVVWELAIQMHPQAPVGVGPYGGDAVGGESAVAFTRAIAYEILAVEI